MVSRGFLLHAVGLPKSNLVIIDTANSNSLRPLLSYMWPHHAAIMRELNQFNIYDIVAHFAAWPMYYYVES